MSVNEWSQSIDFQQATPLQKAIGEKNVGKIKEILRSLPPDALKNELIHRKLATVSTISLALVFDSTRRVATYILRSAVDPKKAEEDSVVTWFELFDMTAKMYRRFRSNLTATRMAQVLVGLKPYITSNQFTLHELASRPKYFIAAWLLGAKYVPRFLGDSFASHVYRSNIITRRDKQRLFSWMCDVGMYTTNPFDMHIQTELLTARKISPAVEYLNNLPMTKEVDEHGFNLLHYAAYTPGSMPFSRAVVHLTSFLNLSDERIANMLLQKNGRGVTPLSILLIKFKNSKLRSVYPEAASTAIRKIIASADLELIRPIFTSHLVNTSKPLFLYLHSCGVTTEMFRKVFGDEMDNPFEGLDKMHASYVETSPEVEMTEGSDSTSFKLDELLPELVYEIASSLSPNDLFSFFTTTKRMATILRGENDIFWSKYHALNYRPLTAPCPSFKQRVILEVRGRQNWQSNKHRDFKFEGHHLCLMDDNWAIMTSDNMEDIIRHPGTPLKTSHHYWNCHTQQMHDGLMDASESVTAAVILSNYNYGNGSVPVYFGDSGFNDQYQIVRGQDIIDCKAVQEFMVGRPTTPYFPINYKLIDHRMFISERSAIYDPEYEKILGHLTTVPAFNFAARYGTYLPYSKQMLVLNHNSLNLDLYDMNHKLVSSVPYFQQGPDRIPVQVDEFTLFYYTRQGFQKPGFIDLRMNQFVEFLSDHIKPGLVSSAVSLNGERIVFTHPMLQIITSWNLRTRRWEFVDDDWFFPKECNLRYLAGEHAESTVIRDYCSNAIKYD